MIAASSGQLEAKPGEQPSQTVCAFAELLLRGGPDAGELWGGRHGPLRAGRQAGTAAEETGHARMLHGEETQCRAQKGPPSAFATRTALHGAARRGHSEVAKLLVQAWDARRRAVPAVPSSVRMRAANAFAGRSLRGHRRLAGLVGLVASKPVKLTRPCCRGYALQ